jgi:hypothetical protein
MATDRTEDAAKDEDARPNDLVRDCSVDVTSSVVDGMI